MTTMLTLALVAVTLTTAAYAQTTSNPNTDQPNRWGQTTSGAAQEGGLGGHASSQPTPRAGLGNVGESLPPPYTTSSKHPSELAQSLCQIDPSAAGC